MANEKHSQCLTEWYKYSNVGESLDMFVPFKAPLQANSNTDVERLNSFSWDNLFSILEERSTKIGLVIDLTHTSFYDKAILHSRGIEYCRLYCSEENELPDEYVHELFANRVDKFLRMQNTSSHIGVHCLTGVNQTGFLICKYLICNNGWRPSFAIEKFAAARGHPIELKLYIDHLSSLDKGDRMGMCSVGERTVEKKQQIESQRSSIERKREYRSSRNSSNSDSRKSPIVKDSPPQVVETKESRRHRSSSSKKTEELKYAPPEKEGDNYVVTRHWSLFGGSSVSKVFVGSETKDLGHGFHGSGKVEMDNRMDSAHNEHYRLDNRAEDVDRVSPDVKISQSLSDRYRNNEDMRKKSDEAEVKKKLEGNFKRDTSYDTKRSKRTKHADFELDLRSMRNNSKSKDHISVNGTSVHNRNEPVSFAANKKSGNDRHISLKCEQCFVKRDICKNNGFETCFY